MSSWEKEAVFQHFKGTMLVSGDVQHQSAIWLNKKTTQTSVISCNTHSACLASMLYRWWGQLYWANILETIKTLDIILIWFCTYEGLKRYVKGTSVHIWHVVCICAKGIKHFTIHITNYSYTSWITPPQGSPGPRATCSRTSANSFWASWICQINRSDRWRYLWLFCGLQYLTKISLYLTDKPKSDASFQMVVNHPIHTAREKPGNRHGVGNPLDSPGLRDKGPKKNIKHVNQGVFHMTIWTSFTIHVFFWAIDPNPMFVLWVLQITTFSNCFCKPNHLKHFNPNAHIFPGFHIATTPYTTQQTSSWT